MKLTDFFDETGVEDTADVVQWFNFDFSDLKDILPALAKRGNDFKIIWQQIAELLEENEKKPFEILEALKKIQ